MDAANQFVSATTTANQEALGNSAKSIASLGEKLAKFTKATGALGGDKGAQQQLIDACKAAENQAQNLVNLGKEAYGKKGLYAMIQATDTDRAQSLKAILSRSRSLRMPVATSLQVSPI